MKTLQIILACLLLLVTVNSTHFFLNISKVKPIEWLVFNACAPSSIIFLLGFIFYLATGNRTLIHISVLPMFFFGGLGLFLFPWSGYDIIAQVSHIIMVLNIGAALFDSFKSGDFRATAIGLLIGIIITSPFINFQQIYAYTHQEDMTRILGAPIGVAEEKGGVGEGE